jgi:hypothetical protein
MEQSEPFTLLPRSFLIATVVASSSTTPGGQKARASYIRAGLLLGCSAGNVLNRSLNTRFASIGIALRQIRATLVRVRDCATSWTPARTRPVTDNGSR